MTSLELVADAITAALRWDGVLSDTCAVLVDEGTRQISAAPVDPAVFLADTDDGRRRLQEWALNAGRDGHAGAIGEE